VFKNAGNNSPASQYMRLIINFSWNNGNSINFGDIALMGSYGGYTSLYDWDYSRNITLKNNLTVPSQVKASQYCDIN